MAGPRPPYNWKSDSGLGFVLLLRSNIRTEVFPIFDSYVEKMLLHFRGKDGFASFKNSELRQYERFVEIIHAFRKHYGLEQFSIKQIDAYLWLEGKAALGR